MFGVGIIGAGTISQSQAWAYRNLPNLAQLVAVADVDLERAESAKRRFGFKAAYQDHRDMLARDDIDVISVCTPANRHRPVVIDAIESGKHVICEKPIAHTLEEADNIIAAADRHPELMVSFVHQLRSDPAHQRTRRLIQQGLIGRVLTASVRIRSPRTSAYYAAVPGRGSWGTDGGGVLVNQAIHQLDALISFLGNPVQVSAVMDTFLQPMEAEDTFAGWIKFEGGAFATFDCTVCSHDEGVNIDVLGENASIHIAGKSNMRPSSWQLQARSTAVGGALRAAGLKEFPPAPADPGAWRMRAQKILSRLRRREWEPPRHWGHTPCIREFLEALESGGEAPIPPREARRSLELAVGAYESAFSNAAVSLPLDDRSPLYCGVDPEKVRRSKCEMELVR